jgi:hypothetical protein
MMMRVNVAVRWYRGLKPRFRHAYVTVAYCSPANSFSLVEKDVRPELFHFVDTKPMTGSRNTGATKAGSYRCNAMYGGLARQLKYLTRKIA